MAEVTDLLVYKKKRHRRKIIKTAVAIVLILTVTYVISFFLYEGGADDTGSFISGMLSYQGGSGYPVNSPGGSIVGMYSIDGNLAVLNDTNLFFYGMNGGTNSSIQHKYQNPYLASSGSKILLYGQGGKNYSTYQKGKLIKEGNCEYPIFVGDIASNGKYVIATKGDIVQTVVTLFDEKGEELFTWESADKFPTAVSLSKDANELVVGSVSSDGGQLISTIIFMNTKKDKPVAEVALKDELILSLEHISDETLIITDKQVFICDNKGHILHTYSLEGQTLSGFNADKDSVSLLVGNYQNNRSYELISLDSSLKKQGNAVINEKVYSIQSDRYGIYLLMGDKLKVFSPKAELKKEVDMEEVQKIFPMGHYVYTVTPTHIYQLDFNK